MIGRESFAIDIPAYPNVDIFELPARDLRTTWTWEPAVGETADHL